MDNYYRKYNLFCVKNATYYIKKRNEDFLRMFNYPINYNMTKDYNLDRNHKHLNKNNSFQLKKKNDKTENEIIKNTISKFQYFMKDKKTKII